MFLSHTDTIRFRTRWAASVGIVALVAWAAVALGDDLLARKVHVDIPAEPLSSALIQLSTQAGVQVAAAHEDVAHVQTQAVKGDYTIEEALKLLLHQSGLSYSTVGNGTVAIRSAARVSEQSDVNVINPGPLPPAEALTTDSLRDFIRHHGTTYTLPPDPYARPARWRGARAETICLVTIGLDSAYNEFVSARIRAVAAYVGAPVLTQAGPPRSWWLDFGRPTSSTKGAGCEPNLEVIFTSEPRKLMDEILTRSYYNGVNTPGLLPFSDTLELSGKHAIQGWWRVVSTDAINNTDSKLIGGGTLRGMWQRGIPTGGGGTLLGTHAPGTNNRALGIINAVLVINTQKVAGESMGTIADYLAFVSLSIAQNPDHCDPLPSILDLTSTSCPQPAPTALTAADLAFLKAIYSRHLPDLATPYTGELETLMQQELSGQR